MLLLIIKSSVFFLINDFIAVCWFAQCRDQFELFIRAKLWFVCPVCSLCRNNTEADDSVL